MGNQNIGWASPGLLTQVRAVRANLGHPYRVVVGWTVESE
jgi:hypothetical protein